MKIVLQMHSIFVGHPFRCFPFDITAYRAAISTGFFNVGNVAYADDAVAGEHILLKIIRQIDDAELCIFDITGENSNVILELGIAIGLGKEYRLLLHTGEDTSSAKLITDLSGWDRLQYATLPELPALLTSKVVPSLKPKRNRSKGSQIQHTDILPFLHVNINFLDDKVIVGTIMNVGGGAAIEPAVKFPGFAPILIDHPLLVNDPYKFELSIDKIRIQDNPADLRALAEFKDKAGTKYRQASSALYPYNAEGWFMDYLLRPFDTPEVIESFELKHRWF